MTLHVHVHSMFMKEHIFRGEQGSGLNEMHFELLYKWNKTKCSRSQAIIYTMKHKSS